MGALMGSSRAPDTKLRWRSLPLAVSVALLVLVGGSAVAIFGARIGSSQPRSIGSWSAAAHLSTGRAEHAATLLKDGRVLVAGGFDGRGQPLASAEIYNPRANSWQPTGTMSTPRVDHTATLLPNGQVLIAGGRAGPSPAGPYLASTELYHPATNRWTVSAPMHQVRAGPTAILLKDGRVMVVGGFGSTVEDGGALPSPVSSAEIYDPRTNQWSITGPMVHTRLFPSVAVLPVGRVLAAGGFDGRGQPLASAEIYNPNLNRWSPTRAMAKACDEATATVLTSSKVFVVGGEGRLGSGNIPVACVELYDPKKDAWSLGADLALARVDHTATLLRNGDVIVVGDGLPGTFPAEIYDPVANRWSNASQPMQRYAHTATRLLDGRVLIVGGYRESLSSVLIYDASGGSPQLNPVVIGLWGFATFVVLGLVTMPFWRPRVAAWFIRQRSDEWAT